MRKKFTLLSFVFALVLALCVGLCIPSTSSANAEAGIEPISLTYHDDATNTDKTTIISIADSLTPDEHGEEPIKTRTYTFADDYYSTYYLDYFGLFCGTNVKENNSKYIATNFNWYFILETFIVPAYNANYGTDDGNNESQFYNDTQSATTSFDYSLSYVIDGFKDTHFLNNISYDSVEGYRYGNENKTFDNFTKDNVLVLSDLSESHNISLSLAFNFRKEVPNGFGGTDISSYKIVLELPAITVSPYSDGDVAYCTSMYWAGCEQLIPDISISFNVSDDLFDENYGYQKDDYTYSWYYIVNDSASVFLNTTDLSDITFLEITKVPDVPYTIRGKLVVTSKSDTTKKFTYYTNKVTVQNYNIEIKTNNIYSTDVVGGKEYIYSLSINRGTVKLQNENAIEWRFGECNEDDILTGQNVLYTFPKHYDENGKETSYTANIEMNVFGIVDEYTIIYLYLYRFSSTETATNSAGVNVCLDESNRIIPSYNLTFNIEDNSAMIIGGDEVDVFAEINEFYGDENFELSYVLSSNGAVADISDTKDKLKLHAVQAGKATIICTATSETAGTFTNSITINIIEKTNENSEILFTSSFHNSKNIVAYLCIGGFNKFLNYTPSWTVVNQNNENIPFVTNEYGSISVSNAENGTYSFSVIDNVTITIPQSIIVSDTQNPTYKISFNVENNSAMVVGGETVEIIPTINEVYGDENFEIAYTISGTSYADDLSSIPGVINLHAIAKGKVLIYVTATSDSAGEFFGSLTISIVEPTKENTSITFNDTFHKTGKDVIAYLNIDGFTSFLNYHPSWTLQIEGDEDTLSNVDFIVDENGNAVLQSAPKGYYQYSVNDELVTTDVVRIRVTNVDFATVAKKALPYVAATMIIAIIVAILIKRKLYKLNTVERHLGKVEDFLVKKSSEMLQTPDKFQHDMMYVENELKRALHKADELDHKSLGQHQALISQLTKALNIALSARKCAKKLDRDAMNKISISLLEKYVRPSKCLAEELTSAIQKFNMEKAGSAETIDPAKQKRQKKNDSDYLEALKEYYRKGDEFDQTNDIEQKN